MTQRPLRPHQTLAIDLLRGSLAAGHRRPMLQLPCGAGKTRIAGQIIENALLKRHRVAFVVPAISLIDQSVRSFWDDGIRDIGVIQADHPMTDWSRPVQVCSIQTLKNRQLPDSTLVLIDEAHMLHERHIQWMNSSAFARVPFVGLSATPWTTGLGKYFDDLIIPATTQDMIDQGYLSQFRVFAPSHPDLTGVRVQKGDYVESDLSEAMNKGALVADIVETWIKLGGGEKTLVFAVDRAHAKSLQARFEECGIPAGYCDAFVKADEREVLRKKFHSGEYKVVVNIGTLTTGVDWDVRCLVLARPTKSEALFTQIIGRALRTAAGKVDALILDHSDTHSRLGFVTDIHHDKLNDGAKTKADSTRIAPVPKECPECKYLRPVKVSKCPNCGFKAQVVSKVEVVGGDLSELGGKPKKDATPPGTIRMGRSIIPLGHFYGMLKWRALERGYSDGWAANQYREAVGSWPRAYNDVEPREPSPEVASWIKSRFIAFAKSKQKREGGDARRAG